MTKQEKIKEAWGENFPLEGVDENGFSKESYWIGNYDHELYDTIPTTHGFSKLRPKSITGIETNNGWIKVESEDLPKESGWYWIKTSDDTLVTFWVNHKMKFVDNDCRYYFNDVTHYKKIEEPNPPIY